jgi:hypothetical protein
MDTTGDRTNRVDARLGTYIPSNGLSPYFLGGMSYYYTYLSGESLGAITINYIQGKGEYEGIILFGEVPKVKYDNKAIMAYYSYIYLFGDNKLKTNLGHSKEGRSQLNHFGVIFSGGTAYTFPSKVRFHYSYPPPSGYWAEDNIDAEISFHAGVGLGYWGELFCARAEYLLPGGLMLSAGLHFAY